MVFGLSYLDIAVIVIYFVVLIYIGFWAMKRVKNQEDFFLGGRRFGKIIQLFAAFGQATSSETGPSITTTTANNGASGIWSALMMLFSTPSYWLTGPWYRRLRVLTMGDYFAERFASRFLGGVYAVMASISLMLLLTVGFISMTKTVLVMTPKTYMEFTIAEKNEHTKALRLDKLESKDYLTLTASEKSELTTLRQLKPKKNFSHIDKIVLIIAMVIVVCLYSVAGGLEAAFISDMLQGVFIILLSVMLLPFAIQEVNQIYGSNGIKGAFTVLHEQLPASFFEVFGSPNTIDFTWYYILALGIMATINVAAGANQLVATASARNEYAARFGLTYGTYLKRITTVLWGITALFIVLLFGSKVSDPDMLWGYASRQLLGTINIGLIGLMIAALMAALMSTADMMMISCSGLLTHNIYRHINSGKSERHYVQVGRLFGASIVIGAALIVIKYDNLFSQLKLFWEWGVVFSAGFWMGILWRRTNRKAVWYSILTTLLLFFLIPLALPSLFPELKENEYLLKQTNLRIIEREYIANQQDAIESQKALSDWEALSESEKATVRKPELAVPGERFTKFYRLPQKSIFWTQGIETGQSGVLLGRGMLSLELVLIDKLGFKLENNTYALNETFRILIRTIFPFLIIFVVSFITTHTVKEQIILDRFYAKMKTKVQEDKQEDEKALLEMATNSDIRYSKLMFPGTQWEILKWNREDTIGFILAMLMVVFIILFLYIAVNFGAK